MPKKTNVVILQPQAFQHASLSTSYIAGHHNHTQSSVTIIISDHQLQENGKLVSGNKSPGGGDRLSKHSNA